MGNDSTECGACCSESSAGQVIAESVLETELPEPLGRALGRFVGTDSIETLGGWTAAIRHHLDEGRITIDALCYSEEPTNHWGTVANDRYHFACFYDAVLLAGLVDEPVDIRTQSPAGAIIEARAVGTDELTVTPPEAVFSFGIDPDIPKSADDGPTLERGYAAICPYVRAFPNRDAYDQWAGDVSAPTIAMPLAGATDLAGALVR